MGMGSLPLIGLRRKGGLRADCAPAYGVFPANEAAAFECMCATCGIEGRRPYMRCTWRATV